MGLKVNIPFDLSKATDDIKYEVDKAILATALEIETDAKRRAPVDTGILRSSINTVRGDKEVSVVTNVEYSIFVEFGTRYQGAQPFLYPAFFEKTRRLTARIARIIFKK